MGLFIATYLLDSTNFSMLSSTIVSDLLWVLKVTCAARYLSLLLTDQPEYCKKLIYKDYR